MPLPGSPPQSNAGQNNSGTAEPYYSNEDVAVLHDIVVLAQELLPKLPERERLPTNALFSAYYDVLPRIGVNVDHDSRYARVLFKIGGLRGPGTLYEKFEEVLSRMGIEIEFDHENKDNDEEYSQLEDLHIDLDTAATSDLPIDEKQPRPMQRRNSESSAWDLGIDLQSQHRTRRNSISMFSKDKASIRGGNDILQEISPAPLPSRTNIIQPPNFDKEKPDHNVGAWLNLRSPKPRRGRGRSVSTHGSMRIRRRSISVGHRRSQHPANSPVPPSEGYLAESEFTAVTSSFGGDSASATNQLHEHQPAHDPRDLMQMKVSLIQQPHFEYLAKQQLWRWRDKALHQREDNIGLDLIAINHDKKSLLRSALDSWRLRIYERHQSAETERFFDHLERRASKVRGLYLLHTAFTHWSNLANIHVQRTALARRHIVRTRIFNAWKDITAVNELKVRRQVLKKFFAVWKRQYSSHATENANAVQKYKGNLVEMVYKQWVRKLWDIKATAWRAEATKRRALFRWIVESHNSWESRRSAEEIRRLDLMWNAWKVWRDQTERHIRQDQEAETKYRNNLLLNSLRKWRREIQVIPAKTTIQVDVATRRLRDAFRIWLYRTRQEQEASAVDRSRILREALTIWRHKSRYQLVSSRTDRRVAAQALYKWIVRERTIFAEQSLKQKSLRRSLQVWLCRWRSLREERWDHEDLAQSFAARKTQNTVLRNWYSRMESKQRLEMTATDFHRPRLMQGLVSKWSKQAQSIQELQRMSSAARFYFIVSKVLKRWKASTEAVKREKRKIAYTQVRRMTKMNLIRGVLRHWCSQTDGILSLRARAAEVSQNKDIIIGMDIFDRWRARAEELVELDFLWKENILKKHFTTWRERSNAAQALGVEAVITYQEVRETRAVKKWSLLTLQLRAQTNYAAEVREKNAKKNFRRIFVYWRQKTLQKRPKAKKAEFIESHQLEDTARAEAWSEFGEENEMDEWVKGLDEGAASTPIPGYLSTPSKRSERVMAVAARFSTTPKAPLSTPFERQLRAQWSGGPSPRKLPGRSTLGMDRGFADIPETSMNNDWKSRR